MVGRKMCSRVRIQKALGMDGMVASLCKCQILQRVLLRTLELCWIKSRQLNDHW